MSVVWTFHLFEAVKTDIDQTPIREQHGEPVGKSLISLMLQAQSLTFVTFFPFLILLCKTHLTEIHDWLMSSSQYTSCYFQLSSLFIFALFA